MSLRRHPDAAGAKPALPTEADAAGPYRAEAARFAVLRRVAPMLRHDMAGAMQPLGMIAMVMQRRMQGAAPDMAAIAKNVASIGTLSKEAVAGCMNAISWLAPREDVAVDLQVGTDEVLKLLGIELSASALVSVNAVAAGEAVASQSYFRSVLVGAILAFCDQVSKGGELHVSVAGTGQNGAADSQRRLLVKVVSDPAANAPPAADKARRIDWLDVQAMADSFGVQATCGEGWVTLGLPGRNDPPAS